MPLFNGPDAAGNLAATVDRYWMRQKGLAHGSLFMSWTGRDWLNLFRYMLTEFGCALHPEVELEVVEAPDSQHPTHLILTREADGLEIVLGVELNSRLYRVTDDAGRVLAFALLGRERPNPVFPLAVALVDLLTTRKAETNTSGVNVYV